MPGWRCSHGKVISGMVARILNTFVRFGRRVAVLATVAAAAAALLIVLDALLLEERGEP